MKENAFSKSFSTEEDVPTQPSQSFTSKSSTKSSVPKSFYKFYKPYRIMSLIVSLWVLVPIYILFVSSFSERLAVSAWPKNFFPNPFSTEIISFFFQIEGVWQATLNSILVALLTMLISISLGVPSGYALARFTFHGKDFYRILVLMNRAFPIAILAIPLTVRFIQIGIYDTPLAVAIIHSALALPFSILVSSSIFIGIPKELEEASWTLGCSRIQSFYKVVMPLALPGIIASGLFAFIISWNEVFASSILTLNYPTLTAYLLSRLGQAPLYFKFAGGFFLIVPAIVFIFSIRKYLFSMWGIANK